MNNLDQSPSGTDMKNESKHGGSPLGFLYSAIIGTLTLMGFNTISNESWREPAHLLTMFQPMFLLAVSVFLVLFNIT